MAIKALNLKQTKVVELDSDENKGSAEATKFTIGALGTQAMMAIASSTMSGNQDMEMAMAYNAVRLGLRNVEGLLDENGKEVKFTTEKAAINGFTFHKAASAEFLEVMPVQAISELAAEIMSFNTITEADEKN